MLTFSSLEFSFASPLSSLLFLSFLFLLFLTHPLDEVFLRIAMKSFSFILLALALAHAAPLGSFRASRSNNARKS